MRSAVVRNTSAEANPCSQHHSPKRRWKATQERIWIFLVASSSSAQQSPVRSLQEIRQEGVIIQKWDTSCGAAALATVLTYSLHEPVSEREVATGMLRMTEPIKVKHQGGFSLLDMKHFVETRGLHGIGYRDLKSATHMVRLPKPGSAISTRPLLVKPRTTMK